jgi:hypothetical protein
MLHRYLCCVVLTGLCVSSLSAQGPQPIRLLLSPAKPPTPALRYQLLPDARITISGDAAPFYRKALELAVKKQPYSRAQYQLFDQWYGMPLNKLPIADMRNALAEYDDLFAVLDEAARHEHCDWHWLDKVREQQVEDVHRELLMTREMVWLLGLRIRLEMAAGQFDQALVLLRNGLTLARHVGESDTLTGYLVGAAIAPMLEGNLDQFIGQPGSPNLYYALMDLPVPLISMRKALKAEHVAIYYKVFGPGADALLNRDGGNLTAQQLETAAKAVHDKLSDNRADQLIQLLRRTKKASLFDLVRPVQPPLAYLDLVHVTQAIQDKHPLAKQALIGAGWPRDRIEAMSPLQVAVLHALLEYDAAVDDLIIWQHLPFWELNERLDGFKKQHHDDRWNDLNAPALPLLGTAGFKRFAWAGARLNRWVALQRTIEAIRFYAATHENRLPPSLAAVKEVPIPLDPVTGKSFTYQLDGDIATLRAAPPPDEPYYGFTYQLRIRK